MPVIGLDIGSRSIECVVLDQSTGQWSWRKKPTTFDPMKQCRQLLRSANGQPIIATGYGRHLLAERFPQSPVQTITEIKAYATGAHHLFPEARTVIDIGGQDSKVIALSKEGKVLKFEMNDRCAAGTGKFLEFMATALQVPLESFGDFALKADREISITRMCTVFAEAEAVSLMAQGERPENIAMGLHMAVAKRILAMVDRVGREGPVVFAGGVAHNRCMCELLRKVLGGALIVPENPDVIGALGAALSAGEDVSA